VNRSNTLFERDTTSHSLMGRVTRSESHVKSFSGGVASTAEKLSSPKAFRGLSPYNFLTTMFSTPAQTSESPLDFEPTTSTSLKPNPATWQSRTNAIQPRRGTSHWRRKGNRKTRPFAKLCRVQSGVISHTIPTQLTTIKTHEE
jgi:hypothetical protein